MEENETREEIIAEIQRRIEYLVLTEDISPEEKNRIAENVLKILNDGK